MKNTSSLTDAKRGAYLDALGIQQWILRREKSDDVAEDVQLSVMAAQTVSQVEKKKPQPEFRLDDKQASVKIDFDKLAMLDLPALEMYVRACEACELHKTRKQTVFGVGHQKADWMIIGEAPGADEDRQGEPFVGRAGQLLTQMLRAIGLAREEVFIANILKCRPPNNRDPSQDEVTACHAFLNRQIELIEPKIVLALGKIAAQSLLQSDIPIGKMRGKLYRLEKNNIPLVVTYHPAYLLRSPKEKRKVWEDLKFARRQVIA